MSTAPGQPRQARPAPAGESTPPRSARVRSEHRRTRPDPVAPDDTERRGKPRPAPDLVDSSYLEGLVGYNARRATLAIIGLFLQRMAVYDLRPVDFSILSLVTHNPGITSRQLCAHLGILPPNLVAMVGALDKRGLIIRKPHPRDGRAVGLFLSSSGEALMREAEGTAAALEQDATARLSPAERNTLIRLLQKIYL